MPLHKGLQKLSHLINGVVFVLGSITTLMVIQAVEFRFFPVKDLKLIDNYEVKGSDLYVSGSFRKLRNCTYIPPVRVVDETGRNLYVVSHSPTAGQSWQPDNQAQKFGPWQIVGGAGKKLRIYQEYECHPLWNQYDNVGAVNARTSKITVETAK